MFCIYCAAELVECHDGDETFYADREDRETCPDVAGELFPHVPTTDRPARPLVELGSPS